MSTSTENAQKMQQQKSIAKHHQKRFQTETKEWNLNDEYHLLTITACSNILPAYEANLSFQKAIWGWFPSLFGDGVHSHFGLLQLEFRTKFKSSRRIYVCQLRCWWLVLVLWLIILAGQDIWHNDAQAQSSEDYDYMIVVPFCYHYIMAIAVAHNYS